MTQVLDDIKSSHLANYSQFTQSLALNAHAWLDDLRRRAVARFEQVGLPTTALEDWRFTHLAPILKTRFTLATEDRTLAALDLANRFTMLDEASCELVFVNGRFSQQLSRIGHVPKGVRVASLAEALQGPDVDLIQQHLARHADIDANPFVALNTSFLHDGAYIHLARGVTLAKPIHVLHVSTHTSNPVVAYPRILMIADANSEAALVESYAGVHGTYLTNAVTEIVVGPDARIDHCKLQQESHTAFHVAAMNVWTGRNSKFVSHSATTGGRVTRNDLNVVLAEEYADATLNGLVIVDGDQHVDNHTLLEHAAANCASHELYKHVLDGKASGVFRGKILVRPGAQKTDSKQTNKSLLLSDDAVMNAQPALEIYADDVKCTHGSTSGPVDEDMVFYLQTRGVSLEAARHLLTYAFAADVTRRIKVAPVRARLEDFMAAQHGLPQDLRITDLGSHDEAAL